MLASLPKELLVGIFYCLLPKDIGAIGRCNKFLQSITSLQDFWKQFYEYKFGSSIAASFFGNWKLAVRHKYLEQQVSEKKFVNAMDLRTNMFVFFPDASFPYVIEKVNLELEGALVRLKLRNVILDNSRYSLHPRSDTILKTELKVSQMQVIEEQGEGVKIKWANEEGFIPRTMIKRKILDKDSQINSCKRLQIMYSCIGHEITLYGL